MPLLTPNLNKPVSVIKTSYTLMIIVMVAFSPGQLTGFIATGIAFVVFLLVINHDFYTTTFESRGQLKEKIRLLENKLSQFQ